MLVGVFLMPHSTYASCFVLCLISMDLIFSTLSLNLTQLINLADNCHNYYLLFCIRYLPGNAGRTTLSFSNATFNICILFRSLSLAFALRILFSLCTSVGSRFEARPLPARFDRRSEDRSTRPPRVDL